MANGTKSFFTRHEFLLRRLMSLSGLVPVGAYMVIHLVTNALVINGPGSYQQSVYTIHGLGILLPLVEWTFIFIPILFHGIIGIIIIREGMPNSGTYAYGSNIRYTLQRATGMIAFVFIIWHVFHMHGWFHVSAWEENIARPLMGSQFAAYNAASTAAEAMQRSWIVPVLYAIGVFSCIFHLANGLWTFGITWGLWTTPEAQRKANWIAGGLGAVLVAVTAASLWGFSTLDVKKARDVEDRMYQAKTAAGEVVPDPHKRADEAEEQDETALTIP